MNDLSNQLTEFIGGSTFDTSNVILAAAALAFGCVMATVPKALRPVALAYLAAMTVVIYLHEMQYLYYGIFGGFAAALIFRTVGSGRAKKA